MAAEGPHRSARPRPAEVVRLGQLAGRARPGALLLLGLGLGLLPGARAETAAPPAVLVGDTYADVIAKLGPPTSEMDAGPNRLLVYPAERIKIRDGLVAEVFVTGAPAAVPTAPAPAPAPAPAGAAPKAPGPGGEMRARKDAIEDEIATFEFTALQGFRREDFAGLEAQAQQLVGDRAVFGDGSWKILCFHQALDIPASAPEQDWQNVEQRIGRWENALPKSVTARVAHVLFLTSYAWHGRGGFIPAAKVAPEGLERFNRRLAQAQAILQAAQGLEGKTPMLWYAGLNLALGRHWNLQDTVTFYIQGKQFEPGFWPLDTQLALYLSPHWNGQPGDWEQFAQAEANRTGGLGTEGYARVVFAMRGFYRNVFKETKAQWPEVRDGYQVLFKKYPRSMQLVNQYAYLASNAGDRDAARWAFDQMGTFVDPFIWNAESIKLFRGWAYGRQ